MNTEWRGVVLLATYSCPPRLLHGLIQTDQPQAGGLSRSALLCCLPMLSLWRSVLILGLVAAPCMVPMQQLKFILLPHLLNPLRGPLGLQVRSLPPARAAVAGICR
ncbi:hypothetical protein Vretimale_17501 [Volvox reticuliferus]|uniref:Uncharacterized protein n=1 Tax=Volvox reticuliferus TaxID=1737510 RepID=A0A8J4LXB5_9CHLO|nr:hypothetical protein Vretimale_17501 [Volvox reticuliferus]